MHFHTSLFCTSTFYYSCQWGPTAASSHGESHLRRVAMGLSPASSRCSDAVSHGSGLFSTQLPIRGLRVSLCTARSSRAQLPEFKQTCSTLILTISTYHSGWVHSINLQFVSADDQWVTFPPRLFILADTDEGVRSPQDIVLQRAFAPPSPGRQRDYTVIICSAILYDSLFHVRDLQSCFINSAWMKPHFKRRGA